MGNHHEFDIVWDPRDPILIATMSGFWTLETVAAFQALIRRRLDERPGLPFDMISDLRRYQTQSQQVHEAMTHAVQDLGSRGLRRGAAVTSSALARMQAQRTADKNNLDRQWFATVDEALDAFRA
jgi:hypothetical protein